MDNEWDLNQYFVLPFGYDFANRTYKALVRPATTADKIGTGVNQELGHLRVSPDGGYVQERCARVARCLCGDRRALDPP